MKTWPFTFPGKRVGEGHASVSPVRSDLAHLMRRAGFGATADELDLLELQGWDATVASLLDFSAPDPQADALQPPDMSWYPASLLPTSNPPSAQTIQDRRTFEGQQKKLFVPLVQWWLQRMAVTAHPLREKLALILHGNFATAISKVPLPLLMYNQNQIFRKMGNGNFEAMTQALAKDPAMMIWLDTLSDKSRHPNENFARELMERFTMGIGNYTETDVREGARGFTGWALDVNGNYVEHPGQHDGGSKTYLGTTGNLGGEDVVHLATTSAASARWVASRLWSYLAYPVAPDDPLVAPLAAGYAGGLDVGKLLGDILRHPLFVSPASKGGLVKTPVEYVVGICRALNIPLTGNDRAVDVLRQLGQLPFDPPNVGGWPQNGYWLSTASALLRWQIGLAAARIGDISPVADAPSTDRLDAAARLLGIDSWGPSTAAALGKISSNPVDLMSLALASPEFVSN